MNFLVLILNFTLALLHVVDFSYTQKQTVHNTLLNWSFLYSKYWEELPHATHSYNHTTKTKLEGFHGSEFQLWNFEKNNEYIF